MAARSNFGQRGKSQRQAAAVAQPTAPHAAPFGDMFDAGEPAARTAPNPLATLPLATAGIIVILCLIFWMQAHHGSAPSFHPDRQSQVASGAIDGHLVFDLGEWWRVFTAPLLHGSPGHLLGNCVALALIGIYMEPLVGAGWLIAIFALSALGGAAGSLGQNNPALVSVGASGAISGLLAAGLIASSRIKDEALRRRTQKIAARILIPAILPAYLSGTALHGPTDYGAHIGGAMTGLMIAFLLTVTWDRKAGKPAFQSLALGISGLFVILAVTGFLMATRSGAAKADEFLDFIPQSEAPTSNRDGIERSANLVARYPKDPRSHFYRALKSLDGNDIPDAAGELRTAIAMMERHDGMFRPEFGRSLKMTLALVIRAEGDPDAARAMAKESCAQEPSSSKLLQTLRRQKICE